MSAPSGRGTPTANLAILAVVVPALAIALFAGEGLVFVAVPLVAGLAVVALERWATGLLALADLPIALAAVLLPTAAAPDGGSVPAFAALAGLGVLLWISVRSGGPATAATRATGLAVPVMATLIALVVAVATPGLAAGPGLAALLTVVGLLVAAGLLADPRSRSVPSDAPETAPAG